MAEETLHSFAQSTSLELFKRLDGMLRKHDAHKFDLQVTQSQKTWWTAEESRRSQVRLASYRASKDLKCRGELGVFVQHLNAGLGVGQLIMEQFFWPEGDPRMLPTARHFSSWLLRSMLDVHRRLHSSTPDDGMATGDDLQSKLHHRLVKCCGEQQSLTFRVQFSVTEEICSCFIKSLGGNFGLPCLGKQGYSGGKSGTIHGRTSECIKFSPGWSCDNIRGWAGLEFAKSKIAVENREKIEETGCKIICGGEQGKWRKLVAKSSVVPQRSPQLSDGRWWGERLWQLLE